MLRAAKDLLERGAISEKELESRMVASFRRPESDGHAEFMAATSRKMVVDATQAVQALNEFMQEKHRGNAAYGRGELSDAKMYYTRATAIVEVIQAQVRDARGGGGTRWCGRGCLVFIALRVPQ